MTVSIERRRICADGGVHEGALLLIDDVLFAVLSQLTREDEPNGHPVGSWFMEAGFGPCGLLNHADQPIFDTLDAAIAWVEGCARSQLEDSASS